MAEDGKGVRYTHSTLRRESRSHGEGVYRVVQPAKETRTGHEGLDIAMQTSLRGIANKAAQDRTYKFRNLFGLLTTGFLLVCWRSVNKRAAAGVDKMGANEFALDLETHVANLVASLTGGWYRAKLVLRKYIPKANGKTRPLGIPAVADKLLQTAVAKILEAIYEQDFLRCSFGYSA